MPHHLIPRECMATPPSSPARPLPHSSQTTFVWSYRDSSDDLGTVSFSTGSAHTYDSKCNIHVIALRPNQTSNETVGWGRTGSVCEQTSFPPNESSTAWRAANAARFPVLALEAKRYLSAPPTSVASERLFSSAAQVYLQMLSFCAQTSLTTTLRSEHYAMLLLRQDAKTSHERVHDQTANRHRPPRLHSLLKSLMECCILPSLRSLIIVCRVPRLKCK